MMLGHQMMNKHFPNIATIMYIENASSSVKYSICCPMITTSEDDMLVPDFWPEIVPTPEDSIFAYTTRKQSYIKALKKLCSHQHLAFLSGLYIVVVHGSWYC